MRGHTHRRLRQLRAGADVHIGGQTVAPAHIDMTMRDATLQLAGKVVVKDGALMLAEAER